MSLLDRQYLKKVDPYLLGVIGVQFAIAIPMLFKALPLTSGWFMAAASEATKRTIYKDFFWFTPPGAVFFEGVVPNLFPSPFFAQDLVHLAYWIFLSVFLYRLISLLSGHITGFISSTIPLTIYFVQPGNIISGYFETAFGFQIAGLFYLVKALNNGSRKQSFLAGLFLGLSVTIRLTALPFLLVVVASSFLKFRRIKGPIKELRPGPIALGASIPWLLILLWSFRSQNTIAMFESIFQTGSKAGIAGWSQIFAASVIQFNLNIWLIVVIVWALGIRLVQKNEFEQLHSQLIGVVSLTGLFAIALNFLNDNAGVQLLEGFLFPIVVAATVFIYSLQEFLATSKRRFFWLSTITFLLLALSIVIGWTLSISNADYRPLAGFQWWHLRDIARSGSTNVIDIGWFGFLMALVSPRYVSHLVTRQSIYFLAMSIGLMRVTDSVAGGQSAETLLVGISLGLVVLINLIRPINSYLAIYAPRLLLIILMPGLILIQRETPYSWLGITRAPLSSNDSNLSFRKSPFVLSAADSDFYNQVNQIVQENEISESDVFFATRNVGLSVLFNINRYPIQCVVLWWDVCPEQLAREDFQRVQKSPPLFAFITFESYDVINSNEDAWNGGMDSYQRKIQEYFQSLIDSGEYRVLLTYTHSPLSASSAKTLIISRSKT